MNWPPRWVLWLCAVPLSIVGMIGTIWAMHHGYLSFYEAHAYAPLGLNDKKIIIYGLGAPFFAVLMAIITFFYRNNDRR